MTTVLYILLGISILAPIYTYVLYPMVLRLFKTRSRETKDNDCPTVSVLIIGQNEGKCEKKKENVRESSYANIIEITSVASQKEAITAINKAKGRVVVVTDEDSTFLNNTISDVVAPLAEPFVGCVCGMVRKAPDEKGEFRDGANWKYENKIKFLESNIGSLSGANTSIYAFTKKYIVEELSPKINLDFQIPTAMTETGFDVVFEPKALTYEPDGRSEQDLFKKHIADGASGYRSIIRFWRLLIPFRKGSFVFWSHRAMKWLVPFNMLFLLVGSGLLTPQFVWAEVLLICQVLFYLYVIAYYCLFTSRGKELPGPIGKLSGFACYFVVLNVAWFLGLFKRS